MAVQTPGTDPLYAWDVPGWTIQKMGSSATAGLNLEESGGPGVGALGSSPAAIDGYLGETVPYETAVTGGATASFVTNTFYGILTYVAEGAQTTKFSVNQTTVGTTTHAYGLLFSVNPSAPTAGTLVANTADGTSSAIGTGAAVSWSATVSLAPGFYYVGVAYTLSVSPNLWGVSPTNAAQHQLNTSATLPRCVSGAYNVTSTLPTTVTLAAATTVGIPWFIYY